MKNGSVTLFATVLSVCFVAGFGAGAVAVMMEDPKTIDIPEGTLVVPENGEPYYYFENGLVITNQVFRVPVDNRENFIVVWPENYAPSSDNFIIVYQGWQDNYVIIPSENTFNVYSIPNVNIAIWYPEDVEWKVIEKSEEYPGWLEIEGRPDQIIVEWTDGYYEYDIHRVLTLGFENIWAFTLRRSG